MPCNITLAASEYQEIHPFSPMDIDSAFRKFLRTAEHELEAENHAGNKLWSWLHLGGANNHHSSTTDQLAMIRDTRERSMRGLAFQIGHWRRGGTGAQVAVLLPFLHLPRPLPPLALLCASLALPMPLISLTSSRPNHLKKM